ncbi:MAG TPA: hypothetical protein EYG21_02180 [Nitrospinaceae bacterium]|jgi:hypothetical protein|nr:hypothetical protein [Nitrospinaceae bacterium]
MIKIKLDKLDAIVHLKARKTMAGDVLIYDHPDIDVMISPSSNKVTTIPKEQYGDHLYATQSRLFDYLGKNGAIDPATVQGGNIFGSLEGDILTIEESQLETVNGPQVALYAIAEFFQKEAPLYRGYKEYEDEFDKSLVDPSEDETTRLGKVPHEPRQGANNTYPGSQAAYGLVGHYYGG